MTFAIVGAGPTGVELAGQIRELAYRSLTRDFRHIDPTAVRVILIDGGKEPLANFGDRLCDRAAKELTKMGVELRMGLRVVGVDALGVDTETRGRGEGPLRVRHHDLGGGRPGVTARPHAGRRHRGRDRPRRTHRRAPRPDPARPSRGVRRRRHGEHRQPARRLRGGHAGRPARGQHDQAAAEGPRRRPLQVPRPRQCRRHRPVQGHRERPRTAPQRLPRMGGVALRPRRLPQRLRPPADGTVAVEHLDGGERPARTRLQRRAHRRRPQPARRRQGRGPAQALPDPGGGPRGARPHRAPRRSRRAPRHPAREPGRSPPDRGHRHPARADRATMFLG